MIYCTILKQKSLFPLWITVHDEPNEARNASNDVLSVQMWNNRHPRQCLLAILAQEVAESQMKARTLLTASRKDVEVWGHAVECAVATKEGFGRVDYELIEAQSMQSGYGRDFADMELQDVLALLVAKRVAADEWVSKHEKLLSFFRDRLPK